MQKQSEANERHVNKQKSKGLVFAPRVMIPERDYDFVVGFLRIIRNKYLSEINND